MKEKCSGSRLPPERQHVLHYAQRRAHCPPCPGDTDRCLLQPHTRIFDLSGRPMQGWILVALTGLVADKTLAKWVKIAVDYAASLPSK